MYNDKELKILNIAKNNYNVLKNIVEENKELDIEDLCDLLHGHNLEEDLFDVNFGVICATIIYKNGVPTLSNNVEVWNDEDCYMIDPNFEMECD